MVQLQPRIILLATYLRERADAGGHTAGGPEIAQLAACSGVQSAVRF
jgi:hypothetical protein